jgi:hypothetical protein
MGIETEISTATSKLTSKSEVEPQLHNGIQHKGTKTPGESGHHQFSGRKPVASPARNREQKQALSDADWKAIREAAFEAVRVAASVADSATVTATVSATDWVAA